MGVITGEDGYLRLKIHKIRVLTEQKVQGQLKMFTLPVGTILPVIRENNTGARAVGLDGTIWILEKGDYVSVEETEEV